MKIPVLVLFFLWLLATAFWWGFAFFQLPGPTPEWITEAKTVCFGQTITGLPDADGWRTLIFPPVFMLLSILFVFFNELKTSLKLLFNLRLGRVFIIFLAVSIGYEIAFISKSVAERWPVGRKTINNSTILPETYPQTKRSTAQFELTNQFGKTFKQTNFIGKKTLLTFAFANCDTICPLIVKTCVDSLEGLDSSAYQLVIITLDPWRDTPSRLTAAAKMWSVPENSYLLSGKIATVLGVLDSFNVPYSRNLKNGFVNHPPLVYIINPEGEIAYSFNNPSQQWIKEAFGRL